jgi:hypothetical protein
MNASAGLLSQGGRNGTDSAWKGEHGGRLPSGPRPDNCGVRSGRVHALVIVAVAALLALFSPTSQAGDAELPKRIGPIVTVGSGPGWSLRAWQSSSGLCISYRPLAGGDFCHVRPRPGSSLFSFVRDQGDHTLVIGAIARNVARVKARDRKGRRLWTRIYEPPRALKTPLRFFRALVHSGSPPKWHVIAYDRELRRVGCVGQGKLRRS